jgi:DNA-binding PadR family transcriptional regulator
MKKLLLLGLLRGQKLHGYGLVDYLKTHSTSGAAIGKSNAYRLLKTLEDDGCVVSSVEREGNRPERHVYKVTPVGEVLFQELMLQSLSVDATADQPGVAVLNFLGEVEPAAAAVELEKRCCSVMSRYEELKALPEDVLHLHPAMDLNLKQLEVELEWLTAKLEELRIQASDAA